MPPTINMHTGDTYIGCHSLTSKRSKETKNISKEAYESGLHRIPARECDDKRDLEYVKRSLHKSPTPHSSAYLLGNVARDRVNADGVLYGLDAEAEECSDEHKRH